MISESAIRAASLISPAVGVQSAAATIQDAIDVELAELKRQLAAAREEIAIDDKLLAERNRLLDLLPCPEHGQCVPHAIDEVRRLQVADIGKVHRTTSCA